VGVAGDDEPSVGEGERVRSRAGSKAERPDVGISPGRVEESGRVLAGRELAPDQARVVAAELVNRTGAERPGLPAAEEAL